MPKLKNPSLWRNSCYINGAWIQAESGETFNVINPYDNTILAAVPNCQRSETKRAIDAAQNAFSSWKLLSASDRLKILLRWATLITDNQDDLARILTLEQGKPLAESKSEIAYANSFITWFAEEAKRAYGDIIPGQTDHHRLFVLKQPIGVVAAITPWNFPAAMITRKIAPALSAGCTVVIKPAEETPLTALALAVLAEQAGFPAGVINVVTGVPEEIGREMTINPLVRKLSFTGSTAVGKLLMSQCAGTIKKVSLELGGNAPFIVFDDADISAAVKGAIASKFRNTGQTCVCANRILVHDRIYDEFTNQFVSAVRQLKVGNGLDADSSQGPLINFNALEKVKNHIDDAVKKGAKIICGGKVHSLGGLFFEPTVLTEASSSMQLSREETFGPVAPLFRFHHEEEAIAIANDTEFGLASYFYSQNINRIFRVAEQLEYGMVGINTGIISTEVAPFGGIKESGIGREGSKYGLDDYLEIKYLCLDLKLK
jgi:succinate-semialdehyde dehydrogenase/glutarate-semialdehyde dehydrogenase